MTIVITNADIQFYFMVLNSFNMIKDSTKKYVYFFMPAGPMVMNP